MHDTLQYDTIGNGLRCAGPQRRDKFPIDKEIAGMPSNKALWYYYNGLSRLDRVSFLLLKAWARNSPSLASFWYRPYISTSYSTSCKPFTLIWAAVHYSSLSGILGYTHTLQLIFKANRTHCLSYEAVWHFLSQLS